MQVTVQTIYDWLDGIAPFTTAEAYDNVGLLVGDTAAEVHKALFCVDVTREAVQEAVRLGAQLLISHHPLMFGGIQRIEYAMPEGRVLQALLADKLNVIAVHTNFDKAPGGTGDSLAQVLGLEDVKATGDYVRMGQLPTALRLEALEALVRERLQSVVRRYGQGREPVSRVAVGPGAAGDGVEEAFAAGAQAYVVGEIKHHELLWATAQGLTVLEAGHYATEWVGIQALYERFLTMAVTEGWSVSPLLLTQAPFSGVMRAREKEAR